MGILQDSISSHGAVVRHSYGFANPNALGMAMTILCMELIYVYGKYKVNRIIIIALTIAMLANYITDSRTSFFAIIIYIVLYKLYTIMPLLFENKLSNYLIKSCPLIIAVVITYLVKILHTVKGQNINDLLSNRIDLIEMFHKHFGIKWFGSHISAMEISLDSGYAYSLIGLGIVFSLMFLISYIKLLDILLRHKEYPLALIFISFAISAIGEKLWIYVDYNILMMTMIFLIYEKKYVNFLFSNHTTT